MTEDHDLDVVIVGAGFAGMYMLHRLRGLGLSARVLRGRAATWAAPGTGTATRVPAATSRACEYSYEFSDELQQEWDWSERYATQPEILALREARRRPVRPAPRHPVRHAGASRRTFDDTTGRWTVRTDRGDELPARFVVMATGCLSSTNLPDFPGRDSFEGASYHTGRWPHEGVDFTGQRVGVIGTGLRRSSRSRSSPRRRPS